MTGVQTCALPIYDSMHFSRATGRSQLESRDDVEIHPGTNPDDPIVTEDPRHLDAPPSQIEDVTPALAGSSRDDKD